MSLEATRRISIVYEACKNNFNLYEIFLLRNPRKVQYTSRKRLRNFLKQKRLSALDNHDKKTLSGFKTLTALSET